MEDIQVSIEPVDGLARRIRLQVPATRIERDLDARLKAVARTANLKGFRPGKVPEGVIRQRFGEQVRREVIQELVQGSYAEAVHREKLQPVGEPRIELAEDSGATGADLVFTVSFDIFPEFEVQGLGGIAVTRQELDIDDADMDFVLTDLRRQRATVREVNGVAEEVLPEVDEAFIRSFELPSGNREEFLERIREYMRDEFEARAQADVQRQVFDALLRANPFSAPAVMVDKEATVLQAEAARAAGAPNAGSTPGPGAYREAAERRVRISLVSGAIARGQGLVIEPGRTLEEQVVQWLTERATVTRIPTHFRSLKET